MSANNHEGDRLWGAGDVARFVKVSERTIWRWRSARKLPKPRYAGKVVRWWRSDIILWFSGGPPPQFID